MKMFYPLLKADDRPTAAEMMAVVEPLLRGALDHRRENGYLDRMASGTYAPELLFPGHPEIAERIRHHPALVWKAKNVADHLASHPQGEVRLAASVGCRNRNRAVLFFLK